MARILVVDDDPNVLDFMCTSLDRAGHQVVRVDDARQVSRLHEERPVDLIITDLFMPERDGLQTIMEMRERFPGLPIIAVSGGGSNGGNVASEMLEVASRFGAQVLEKPFGSTRLRMVVDDVLAPQ